MSLFSPLVDTFGRKHTSLRVSVTDRCNIRCFYCMPDENLRFLPRKELLSFEEIERFIQVATKLGVRKIRITGGEPLVRADLSRLVAMVAAIDGVDDVALTTNGILLPEQAAALKESGLQRVNISLDTLSEETFRRLSRRSGLDRVLAGIESAIRVGFRHIRLNAVAIPDVNGDQIVPLAEFARNRDLELRFIEFMPLDAENHWESARVLSGEKIRQTLECEFGPLKPLPRKDPSQPAVDFHFSDGQGRIGFINSVTQPFCRDCNRLRLTAEGQIRNCLFSTTEWDARRLLRSGATDTDLAQLVHDCLRAKKVGHGIDTVDFVKPARAMYQIGG